MIVATDIDVFINYLKQNDIVLCDKDTNYVYAYDDIRDSYIESIIMKTPQKVESNEDHNETSAKED